MKAVDGAYPLYGAAQLDPAGPLPAALAEHDGVFGAVADPTLMTRLDIKPGARIAIGNARFEVRAALTSEPDKLAGGIGFGPRFMVSEHALCAPPACCSRAASCAGTIACACRRTTRAMPPRAR